MNDTERRRTIDLALVRNGKAIRKGSFRARQIGERLDYLLLTADGEFHVLPRGLRSNRYFGEFRPIALFGYPHH